MDISKATTPFVELFQQNRTLCTAIAATVAAGGTISIISHIVADYRAWYALGPNGLPLNIFGYLFQSIGRSFARLDTRVPAPYDNAQLARSARYGPLSQRSFFSGSIPSRKGARPEVPMFVGPHRQTSQQAAPAMRSRQEAFLDALAAANPSLIRVRPSNLEGPLFRSVWLQSGIALRDEIKNLNGEFAHPHAEGSTHMVLSLVDAAAAIERGWSERHRMSGVAGLMPWGFVMVYAPRDDGEFRVWREFMVASARYVLGGDKEVVMPGNVGE
ncbi:putative phospholipase carboxylesterase protein [Daldinia childiae]|uniref:putative phospholipase carboxylesterase protein n=1 Tax=Daldinia childiae TaxID=326645 RepID=UPI0014487D71|nr:putative phospholipase carboxylesterase protein [Daldinia childiae]KAF3064965.1 putative phospholipase carboxylesterase protein [Daldinia childiae]